MVTYKMVAQHYSTNRAPTGFRTFSQKHGVANPNTCAVRLSHALRRAQQRFFIGVEARSGVEWRDLPTRASDLAIILNRRIGQPRLVRSSADLGSEKGIIFFDTIRGFGGTGHITLWTGEEVADGGDYFSESPRVYFWRLN